MKSEIDKLLKKTRWFTVITTLCLVVVSLLAVTGCEKEELRNIQVMDKETLNQTLSAKETEGKSVTIQTLGAWAASCAEEWITFDTAQGDEAGTYTIAIHLLPNITGLDRKATITIVCNGTRLAVSIMQQANNEDGSIPKSMTIRSNNGFENIGLIGSGEVTIIVDDDISSSRMFDLSASPIDFRSTGNMLSIIGENIHKLVCPGGSLTYLDVSNNPALTELFCQANQLTTLIVSNTALTDLICFRNQLTELDVSNNTALENLDCEANQLTSLDVSNNTALKTLACANNQITSLDVRDRTDLLMLSCYNNQLSELDISNNSVLTFLNCMANHFTELDVSNNTELESLYCSYNPLKYLNISNNTSLTTLHCYENELTELDISHNLALTTLACRDNQLTELEVRNHTALTELACDGNLLKNLDISKNLELTSLNISRNQLTELDIKNHVKLLQLSCYDNSIAELDVSANPLLINLDCQNNQLFELDVSNNKSLQRINCKYNNMSSSALNNLFHSLNSLDWVNPLILIYGNPGASDDDLDITIATNKGWIVDTDMP